MRKNNDDLRDEEEQKALETKLWNAVEKDDIPMVRELSTGVGIDRKYENEKTLLHHTAECDSRKGSGAAKKNDMHTEGKHKAISAER